MPSRYALTWESHLTVRCGARPWQNAVSAFKGVDDMGNGNPLQYSCLEDLDLCQYCLILNLSGVFYDSTQACAYFTTQLFSLLCFPRTVLRKQLGLRKHVNSGCIELGFPK